MGKTLKTEISICWLRRDLRLFDNAALYHALNSGLPVLVIFIFDSDILITLPDRQDRRVAFIHHRLQNLNEQLRCCGRFDGLPKHLPFQLKEFLAWGIVFATDKK